MKKKNLIWLIAALVLVALVVIGIYYGKGWRGSADIIGGVRVYGLLFDTAGRQMSFTNCGGFSSGQMIIGGKYSGNINDSGYYNITNIPRGVYSYQVTVYGVQIFKGSMSLTNTSRTEFRYDIKNVPQLGQLKVSFKYCDGSPIVSSGTGATGIQLRLSGTNTIVSPRCNPLGFFPGYPYDSMTGSTLFITDLPMKTYDADAYLKVVEIPQDAMAGSLYRINKLAVTSLTTISVQLPKPGTCGS